MKKNYDIKNKILYTFFFKFSSKRLQEETIKDNSNSGEMKIGIDIKLLKQSKTISTWNKAIGLLLCSTSQQSKSVCMGENNQKAWFHTHYSPIEKETWIPLESRSGGVPAWKILNRHPRGFFKT